MEMYGGALEQKKIRFLNRLSHITLMMELVFEKSELLFKTLTIFD